MSRRVPEVEATLLVVPGPGREAADTADRVARLRRLGGARLRGGGTRELRDAYYDTADRRLRDRGLALRLRTSDGVTTLAQKGEERLLPGGGLERLEIESGWSPEALDDVRSALDRRGVELTGAGSAGPGTAAAGPTGREQPGRVLEEMGLEPVQRRTTTRRTLRIGRPASDGPAGELVVDRVAYGIPDGGTLTHREVEVEAVGPAARQAVGELSSALLSRFGGRLRRWDHGKLETGEAIRALARRGALDGAGGEGPGPASGGELTPGDYAAIEALLEEWKGGGS